MPRKTPTRHRRGRLLGFLLALPAMILLFLFLIWPVFVAGEYSLTSASGYGDKDPVGLENYARAFTDQALYAALGRNVIFAIAVVTSSVLVGFVLAYFLYLRVRAWRALQVIFMIPFIMPAVVVALLWQFMLEPTSGLVNTGLRAIGLDALAGPWLTGEATALGSVSFIHVWATVPLAMLLIFAAMVALPGEVFEAAEIDGAGHVRRMFSVALPMLRPTIILVTLLLTIDVFRSFDMVYLLTRGGPINSTTIATLYVYVTAFVNNEYGYANALGIVVGLLLVLFAIVPVLVRRILQRRATVEGITS
jgi:raffinose/stachyose/melibiose transport system permease protein